MMGEDPGEAMAAGVMLDLTIIGSVASVAYGSWLVFQPAGFIVGGLLALCLSLGLAAGAAKKAQPQISRNAQPPRER